MKTTPRIRRTLELALLCAMVLAPCKPLAAYPGEKSMWERSQEAIDEANRRDAERREREYRDSLIRGGDNPGTPAPSPSSSYAAIVYSTSTKRWGYAYGYGSLEGAQTAARKHSDAADAAPVGWAVNGWYCALALGSNGSYGCGSAPTRAGAMQKALEACNQFGTGATVVACVCAN